MEQFVAIVEKPQRPLSAVQFKGKPDNDKDNTFAGFPTREDPSRHPAQIAVLVPTSGGGTPAFPGDWIVSDADGKLSVVPDAYFVTHYKSTEATPPAVSKTAPAAPAFDFAAQQQITQQKAAEWAKKQTAKK
jgi:hypothetical protein